MAMHQVAQYWNECMQIADEEQDYASWKIDALQDNLHRYQLKLSDARSQLEDKKGELRRMETCYQQLQEKTGRSAEHSKNLERDIESLQAELSGTRERATEFEERTRRYRGKINETITEQQNLWKRSRDFHTMTMTDLQQDRENRMSESKRLEEALEVSRHKREEMSKCLEELRGHMDHERKAKDKVISDLQCKLMEQENRIRRDNDLATLVNRQLKAQESTQETVSMLESKVESLLVQSRKTRHELDEDVASIADTYRKIETLVERLEDWEENTLLAAINDTTQKMTDQFEAHVKCALSEASENHQIAMTTVHELLSGLQSNLKTISQEMDRQDGEFKTSRASGVEAREKIRERIDKSQRDLNAMRNDMKQFRDELLLEFRSGKDFAAARMDLMKQLDQRDKTFHSLEQQLRSLTEETSRKLTALRERALHTEQSGQLEIRNVVSSLERSLEQGFKAAQVGSERNLRQTQSAMAAFGGQLRAIGSLRRRI
ncbi:acetate--CoA ligase [Purpureocillium lavendulum]|uniref:Acetate--CoA ligase n=1 Tax=Purpureocillium lavendulum TaxID=1247861 RepID=A0AB34FT89_9HYPO|nr:acetate--CoA ligase [Purpureocillium lavendulum]